MQRLFRLGPCDCPQCGARCREHESHCWFCQHDLAVPASPPVRAGQFSLAMMLLAMTLLGACLALFRLSPTLGMFAALTIVPAAWRTCAAVAFSVVCVGALPFLLLANWLSGTDFTGLELVGLIAAAGAAAFTLIAMHWLFWPE